MKVIVKTNDCKIGKRILRTMTCFTFLFFLSIMFASLSLNAQEIDPNKEKDASIPQIGENTTGYSGSRSYSLSKNSQTNATGNAKYLRFSIHSGNLVYGGVINSGLLSYHYVSGTPRISWPKGAKQVQYLHGGVFYVAAEVEDAHGDTIHIVSDNYRRSSAEASLDQSHWYGFMPLPKYFNNDQPDALSYDISGISEDMGIDGVPGTGDEGEGDGILQSAEDINGNGELDLRLQNELGWFAMSDQKETWPEYWPAGSYPGDTRAVGTEQPGVRAGKWNGEYGAYARADQESYYVMDDRENDEFDYYPFDDESSKQDWPNGKRGLGVTVEVRNYEWSSILAEDILISVYDVTNKGKDLEKCVVGMYVDPDLGGTTSGDDADFDNDEDITYAFNTLGVASDGLEIGFFGFAFLESPGLANDGLDNDGDGMVDESRNNGIDDDGDWEGWIDSNGNGVWDNEDKNLNGILDSGEDTNGNGILDVEELNDDLGSDGLGPNNDEYSGPDADGSQGNGVPDEGEPNFDSTDNDESDQVGLTSFYLRSCDDTMAKDETYWSTEIKPSTYTVKPGYQNDIAWSYGSGYVKFSGTEKKQRYAIALLFGNDQEDILRNKKTMQVIYDADYNFSKAPRKPRLSATAGNGAVYLTWDSRAESSVDPIYGKDFEAYYIYKSTSPTFEEIKTISDAYGNPLLYKPVAIYDVVDGLKGIHPVRIGSEVGEDSDLGISYNMGTDSGLKHFYIDTDVTNGRTYYYAVVSVDRGYSTSFYPEITNLEGLQEISPTECSSNIETDLLGRAIGTDDNTAYVTPEEESAGWVEPSLSEDGITQTSGSGTGKISLGIFCANDVVNGNKYKITFTDDASHETYGENYTGNTSSVILTDVTNSTALAAVNDLDDESALNEFIAHGLQVYVENDTTQIDTVYWSSGSSTLSLQSTTEEDNGITIPRDYEIRVGDMGIGASVNSTPISTNFQVWDITDPANEFQVGFRYVNTKENSTLKGVLSEGDKIQIVSDYSTTKRLWIFEMYYPSEVEESNKSIPTSGDVLKIKTKKSFDRNDVFEFTMVGNSINTEKTKTDMNNIYTVPDPYVAVNSLERQVVDEDEGRGDRRVDFVNLPSECTIQIFTTSGKLVRKLTHSATINNSREAWDLRTKDGLEVSHGVYFWVVDAPGVGTKIGRLAIIK